MIKITQAPSAPIQVRQQFAIAGVASAEHIGKALTLVVDNTYRTRGPIIAASGEWGVSFLFTQSGNRRLRIEVDDASAEITVRVVDTPVQRWVSFTNPPQQVQTGQTVILQGAANGYSDGTQLLLRADGLYDLARPQVQLGTWQAAVSFTQAGNRRIELIGAGQDRAEIMLPVVAAPPRPPRPPRLSFTNPPQEALADRAFLLKGTAIDYRDGDQLVVRADQLYELARPRVRDGRWESAVLLRSVGKRLIEIIGSEQDRAQITIDIKSPPSNELVVLPRSSWTNIPTPVTLPTLQPQRLTLHHTALRGAPPINATQAQEAERMRLIYNSHVAGNGWSDIGYHFIIMPSGRVFAARDEQRRGAHDQINDGLGVAFDGLFTSATISEQQYQSAVALCTQLCRRYGFRNVVNPVPTPTTFGTRNLPLILGHRDRVSTECPGSAEGRTVRMEEIRRAVQSRL